MRNPIDTGDIVAVLGIALALGELRGQVGLLLIVLYALHKGRAEERILLEEFGDAFVSYRRKVRCLIPFLFYRTISLNRHPTGQSPAWGSRCGLLLNRYDPGCQ